MTQRTRYAYRFSRIERIKELMLARALRRRKVDFDRNRPVASIIGDHISDRIRVEGIYERNILEILREQILDQEACGRMVAIDVGANIGNHTLFLSDLFAKVIAFEPNELARSLLRINLDMNGVTNVDLRPVGLSDRPGRLTLTFEKANLGAARLRGVGANASSETVEVELTVGDDEIDPSESVGFIKIDVEGAEEAVLRGLEQTIRKHMPILMIEQLEDGIDPVTGASAPFVFLRNLGYSAYCLRTGNSLSRKLSPLANFLLGRRISRLDLLARLEKRDYPALFFMPDGIFAVAMTPKGSDTAGGGPPSS